MSSINQSGKPCKPTPPSAPRLLDQLRQTIRYRHLSLSTEKTYAYWVRWFIRWHGLKHPAEMGGPEVEAFLSWLATERRVSPSTHKQALSAILFLYLRVLNVQLPWMAEIGRSSQRKRIPVVLTTDEVTNLLGRMQGETGLIAQTLYGTGMRHMEALKLRVKDIESGIGQSSCATARVARTASSCCRKRWKAQYANSLLAPASFGKKTARNNAWEFGSRTHWKGNFHGPANRGRGSGYFPRLNSPRIHAPGSCAAITCTSSAR